MDLNESHNNPINRSKQEFNNRIKTLEKRNKITLILIILATLIVVFSLTVNIIFDHLASMGTIFAMLTLLLSTYNLFKYFQAKETIKKMKALNNSE